MKIARPNPNGAAPGLVVLREHPLDKTRMVIMYQKNALFAVAVVHKSGVAFALDYADPKSKRSALPTYVDEILDWVDQQTAYQRFVALGGVLATRPTLQVV